MTVAYSTAWHLYSGSTTILTGGIDMAIIIIGFIVGIIIYGVTEGFDSIGDFFCAAFVGLIGALVGLIIALIPTALVPTSEYNYGQTKNTPIVALKDNQGIVGTRYILSGNVKSTMYYYYATEEAPGIRVDNVQASNAYIRYDNDSPRIERYTASGFKHWYTWLYAVNFGGLNQYYIIYVPEGTVEYVYEVDLE